MKNKNEIRDAVRERYDKIATTDLPADINCCTYTKNNSCCSSQDYFNQLSLKIGYSVEELKLVPEGSNMGLGCGNPQTIAKLKEGETVIDLGCGAGFDAFLAVRQVGQKGKVIGVDMTPSMISKARKNAEKINENRVEFRLGEIEHLPVADETADVIISNCVINLSPEKEQVFCELYRALKKGGRLAISDIVSIKELPELIKADMELYGACISGASSVPALTKMLKTAGFSHIQIKPKTESKKVISEWNSNNLFAEFIVSADIEAIKY